MQATLSCFTFAVLVLSFSACVVDDEEDSRESSLTVTGQIDTSSFGSPINTVQLLGGGNIIAEAPIGADGRFELAIPPGSGYQIVFASGNTATTLIFPRQSGTIDTRFEVLGGGSFDLGTVRYIGDPRVQSYQFSAMSEKDADQEDDDEIECEDGVDPNTGAVCVDDDDDEVAGMCGVEEDGYNDGDENDDSGDDDGDEDDDEESDDEDDDDVNCEDGIDSTTGLECDGGPDANADDDGDEDDDDDNDGDDDDGEESDDEVPSDAAVADHNLPSSLGCPDSEDVDCENGIDTATGLECDGGPEANRSD